MGLTRCFWTSLRTRGRDCLLPIACAVALAASLFAALVAAAAKGLLAQGAELVHQGKPAQAVELFTRAADAGDPAGAYGLGVLYSDGKSLPRDPAKSVRWMRRAAEQGFPPAQFNLGNAYLEGQGLARDAEAAADWWRKAGRQRLTPACYNLGLLLSREGSSAELREEGIAWFRVGAAQGEPQARSKLEALGESLLLAQEPIDPAREPQRSEGQIMTMDSAGYTIQLFSASRTGSAEKFIAKMGLEGEALRFRFPRDGATWHAVIYGWFPDRASGRSIIKALKPELARGKPWLRPVAEVQALILATRRRDGTGIPPRLPVH